MAIPMALTYTCHDCNSKITGWNLKNRSVEIKHFCVCDLKPSEKCMVWPKCVRTEHKYRFDYVLLTSHFQWILYLINQENIFLQTVLGVALNSTGIFVQRVNRESLELRFNAESQSNDDRRQKMHTQTLHLSNQFEMFRMFNAPRYLQRLELLHLFATCCMFFFLRFNL